MILTEEDKKFLNALKDFNSDYFKRAIEIYSIVKLNEQYKSANLDEEINSYFVSIIKPRLSAQVQKKEKLVELLIKLKSIVPDNELKNKIASLVYGVKYTNPIKETLAELLKWWKTRSEDTGLYEWDTLFDTFFDAVETSFSNDRNIVDNLEKILNLYDLRYDTKLDVRNFKPGTKMFDPANHQELRKVKSQFPHNTIIKILKMGIINNKVGSVYRKPLVIVSFGL